MSIFHILTLLAFFFCVLGWGCTFSSLLRCKRYNDELMGHLDVANEKVRSLRNELCILYAGMLPDNSVMVQQTGRALRNQKPPVVDIDIKE